ncbi:MAG: FkbM family methyltransferase [Chloroflexota bacterium]
MNHLTDLMPELQRDCVYDIAEYLRPSLFIDVGAAAGHVVQEVSNKWIASLEEAVGFEPFPNNHQYFEANTKDCDCAVRLIKKAVSDEQSQATFFVSATVQGNETGWEDYVGYSSLGSLLSSLTLTQRIKNRLKYLVFDLWKRKGTDEQKFLTVETTTLDHEFNHQQLMQSATFLKIDVQGAEEQVLNGSRQLLSSGSLDIIYIEWSGETSVLDILSTHGYTIYDTTYVVFAKEMDSVHLFEELGMEYMDTVQLSTGRQAYEMIMKDDPLTVINKIKKHRLGNIQTDLIAVHDKKHSEFLDAIQTYQKKYI